MVQIKRMFRLLYHELEEIRNWIFFQRKDMWFIDVEKRNKTKHISDTSIHTFY